VAYEKEGIHSTCSLKFGDRKKVRIVLMRNEDDLTFLIKQKGGGGGGGGGGVLWGGGGGGVGGWGWVGSFRRAPLKRGTGERHAMAL